MDAKEQLFKALDTVIDGLKEDLGRQPEEFEIMTRLALLFGVYAGGFAQTHEDPLGCIDRAIAPARQVARDTLSELTR
jgi:hypothetical protein